MSQPPIFIRSIAQVDNETFSIVWSDGAIQRYRLDALQKKCPCAKCHEMKKQVQPETSHPEKDVSATNILSVGRYAIKVNFTSGCSNGIYSFAMLRDLAEMHEGKKNDE